MAVKLSRAEKKVQYDQKLCRLLDEYSQILIVAADNVGSKQLQDIRRALRCHSVVLMGKNTMMKRSVRLHVERTGNKAFLSLIPLLVVSFMQLKHGVLSFVLVGWWETAGKEAESLVLVFYFIFWLRLLFGFRENVKKLRGFAEK